MEKETNEMKVVTKENCISLETVFEWIKGENKIPNELKNQLSQIPHFKHLNKDVDDTEIEIAYLTYRSSIDSRIGYDAYGFPMVIDPHEDEIQVLFHMRDRIKEINKVENSYMQPTVRTI